MKSFKWLTLLKKRPLIFEYSILYVSMSTLFLCLSVMRYSRCRLTLFIHVCFGFSRELAGPFLLPCPRRRPFFFCACTFRACPRLVARSGDLLMTPFVMSFFTSNEVIAPFISSSRVGSNLTRCMPHFIMFAANRFWRIIVVW